MRGDYRTRHQLLKEMADLRERANEFERNQSCLHVSSPPFCRSSEDQAGRIESIQGNLPGEPATEKELVDFIEKIKFFTCSVLHDLKSPIIGINGLARLLERQYGAVLDKLGRTYCEQILKASEQAVMLIEGINTYIRTKETPLRFEEFSLYEVVQTVREEFDGVLIVRQINWVESDIAPILRADKISVLRVLRNLVDNAIKYGGPGLSEVKIEYRDTEEFHVISVTDDGVGISKEECRRIFGLFQREASARGIEGMGLGLAIVKEIAAAHGGKVLATPGQKKGVTFRCFLSKAL